MKRKKILAVVSAFVLVFAFVANTYAYNALPISFNGGALRTFTTTDSITKNASMEWTEYGVEGYSVTYTGTQFSYFYARPVTTSGGICSISQQVYPGQGRKTYTPNETGKSANPIKCKITNADYELNGIQTNSMRAIGALLGTFN